MDAQRGLWRALWPARTEFRPRLANCRESTAPCRPATLPRHATQVLGWQPVSCRKSPAAQTPRESCTPACRCARPRAAPVGRVESGWGHEWARLVVVSDASLILFVVSISAETVRDLWQAKLAATSEPFRSEGSPGEDRLVRLLRTMPIPVLDLDPARTWLWSDLHLGDPVMLAAWARPFRNVEHMNRSLLAQWRRRVRPGDTLVCLGDVVYLDAWFDPDFAVDLAACPGDRLLIIGNHDVDQFGNGN